MAQAAPSQEVQGVGYSTGPAGVVLECPAPLGRMSNVRGGRLEKEGSTVDTTEGDTKGPRFSKMCGWTNSTYGNLKLQIYTKQAEGDES